MPTANLHKVNDTVMPALPQVILRMQEINSDSSVTIEVDSGYLIIKPQKAKTYLLKDLLAQCDADMPLSEEDKVWTVSSAQGKEEL